MRVSRPSGNRLRMLRTGIERPVLAKILTGALLMAAMLGCDRKIPSLTEFDTTPLNDTTTTAYLELTPPIFGFSGAEGMVFGFDQLLYVADTKNNRVVQLDLSGHFLSTRLIGQPYAISQDRRMDLLVTGVVATGPDSTGDVAALFRIKLVSVDHRLDLAPIETLWTEVAHPRRRFTGIAALPDNEFLAVRQGPDNSSFVDPDARVLRFAADNAFLTPIGDLVTQSGTGIRDINQPTGICLFPNSFSFILLQSNVGVAYGAIWMVYVNASDFVGWQPKFDPANQVQRIVDFVRPNRFLQPSDAVIDSRRGDIFIGDAVQDSIFKFDNTGTFKMESFGLSRSRGRMLRPTGLAFYNKTLFVLDATANCIFRFKLSSDF